MTPAAFHAYVSGYMDEQKDAQELRQANSYALAVMIRAAVWEKRMPSFKRFFRERKSGKKRKKEQAMSDEQMYQNVLALNAALGGRVNGE